MYFWEAASVDCWNSLEDELLQYFGGENILAIMKKMGMNENEEVSHSMISKALQNAQRKIAEQVVLEVHSNSEKDWFEKNLPHKGI